MSNGTRPKVTSITVKFDNNMEKTYTAANGYMPVALFWSDETVVSILGSYYDGLTTPHMMTYEKLLQHFGKIRADAICPNGPGHLVEIRKDTVITIWNMPNQTTMLGIISKDPDCDIGG